MPVQIRGAGRGCGGAGADRVVSSFICSFLAAAHQGVSTSSMPKVCPSEVGWFTAAENSSDNGLHHKGTSLF